MIYNEDCLETFKKLEDDSVDLLVTDPPYGISFMGKSWDKALPDKKIWKECLRVLKPGSFVFVMSIPRSDCLSRMIISLEDAGFNVGFSPIYWAYASGFPKAQNISKMVDKRRVGDKFQEIRDYLRQSYKDSGKTQKQLAYSMGDFTTGGGRISHYFGNEQPLVPNWKDWCVLKSELNMDNRYDYFIQEFEREILGVERERTKQNWCPTSEDNNTYITEPQTKEAKALDGSYGGFQPKPAVEVIIVCMKPLSEKTYVDQALKNGKGITWLDDCRIPTGENLNGGAYQDREGTVGTIHCERNVLPKDSFVQPKGRFPANLLTSDNVLDYNKVWIEEGDTPIVESDSSSDKAGIRARVKPMVMPLFTESQEVRKQNSEYQKLSRESQSPQNTDLPYQKQGLNSTISEAEKSGELIQGEVNTINGEKQSLKETGVNAENMDIQERTLRGKDSTPTTSRLTQNTPNLCTKSQMESPSASPVIERQRTSDARDNFSRFFDLDKWAQKTFPFLICAKASKREKNKGCEDLPDKSIEGTDNVNSYMGVESAGRRKLLTKNNHPTVKPLKLMSYLITLGSREGDVVLDPFIGSGTTALACQLLNRKCIGSEINKDYYDIAIKRTENAKRLI